MAEKKKQKRIDLYNIPKAPKRPKPKRLDMYTVLDKIYGKRKK